MGLRRAGRDGGACSASRPLQRAVLVGHADKGLRVLYALDMHTGCTYWDYRAPGGVRTAITVARVGGRDRRAVRRPPWTCLLRRRRDRGNDLEGRRRRRTGSGDHQRPGPVREQALCSDRERRRRQSRPAMLQRQRAVVALDAATRDVVWTTFMTPEATPQGRTPTGARLYGPSGASVWSAPTIDARNRLLYVGPATTTPLRRPIRATRYGRSGSTTARLRGRNSLSPGTWTRRGRITISARPPT